ncbi:hypothetical protein GCM10018966_000090 [Streptomyces yanii]
MLPTDFGALRNFQQQLAPSSVDEVLTAPDVARLFTDAEVVGDLPDRTADLDEIEDLASERDWLTTGRGSLLEHHPSSKVTPPDPGHIGVPTEPGAVQVPGWLAARSGGGRPTRW